MGLLKNEFKKEISKGKLGVETEYIPFHSTGIDIFDYINGVRKSDNSIALGIQGGRIIQIVGPSGSGKTTFGIKIAGSIAETYENSDVWHYDFERSSSKERVQAIMKWSEDEYEDNYQIFQKDISVETIYRACKSIEKIKMDNKDDIQIPSGNYDKDGKEIMIFPPTVLLVDSVAMLAPEDIEDDDELKGSMGAAAIAKANTNIFKRILSPMENANIILILINHITQKIEIGPVRSKAQVNYLGQDESIPGGKSVTYLSNTLLKLDTGSKLEPDKEFGIKGFYLSGKLVKCRSAAAGISFKMVFDQENGVDNVLTNFVNLKDNGIITGGGRSYHLNTCPDVKFSLKEFKSKYNSNPELKKAFDKAVKDLYIKYIPEEGTPPKELETNNEYILFDEEEGVYTKDGKYYIIENNEYVEVEYTEE